MKRALLIFVLHATLAPGVFAHEVRPAYLELRQTGPETYDVLWKTINGSWNLFSFRRAVEDDQRFLEPF